MPVMFVGHGSPMNAVEDNEYTKQWKRLGGQYKPKGILMISGHWVTDGTKVQSTITPKKIDDMYGFPKALYELKYPVTGDQLLTSKVIQLTGAEIDDSWGIDHGAWSVLVHMYPEANVPMVQMSLDQNLSPREHYELGKKLASLQDEGYLVIGSGNVVHSFKYMDLKNEDGLPFAIHFDDVIEQAILSYKHDICIDYQKITDADKAVPTTEHYDPLLYILGMAGEKITVFNKSVIFGGFSMTGYVFEKHA